MAWLCAAAAERARGAAASLAYSLLRQGELPRHVAFIMDGNRRFAQREHLPTSEGHSRGFDAMLRVLEPLLRLGIRTVTVYAFSIDNFQRSAEEVDALMSLARDRFRAMSDRRHLLRRHAVRVRIVGDLALLPADLEQICHNLMEETRDNAGAVLNIAFPYTARHEMATALEAARRAGAGGSGAIDDRLMVADPVDLMVRSSGERRLSDFLTWQAADDALLEFTDALWPDMTEWDAIAALARFQMARATWKSRPPALRGVAVDG